MALNAKAYGSWPSNISADLITRATPNLNFVQSYGYTLYWVEARSWEAGRSVIMCRDGKGNISDLLPAPFSHYSKVHGYGGMAYALTDDYLFFVNAADQIIYKFFLTGESSPQAVTNKGPWRFADLIVDTLNQRLIAVCKEHTTNQEPQNYLASISLKDAQPKVEKLIFGADFYAYPRLSPDQNHLCWIEWQHPNMPWDATQLWQASISRGELISKTLVVGSDNNQAIFQPHWSPDNTLYYVSDKTNWWNLYRLKNRIGTPVLKMKAEFAIPLWQLGMTTFDFVDCNTIACIWTQNGIWHSGFIDIASGVLSTVET